MKIGELAKSVGCQAVTIRFYERKGLLEMTGRSSSNYRVYGSKDMDRLVFIRNCRAFGLTLPEIKRLVEIHDNPAGDCGDVNACLDNHLVEVDKQIQALSQLREELMRLRGECLTPGAASGCGVLAALGNTPPNIAGSTASRVAGQPACKR